MIKVVVDYYYLYCYSHCCIGRSWGYSMKAISWKDFYSCSRSQQQVWNCETNDHWAGADLSVLQLGALYFLIVFSRFIFNMKSTFSWKASVTRPNKVKLARPKISWRMFCVKFASGEGSDLWSRWRRSLTVSREVISLQTILTFNTRAKHVWINKYVYVGCSDSDAYYSQTL